MTEIYPREYFADSSGLALENGKLYLGEESKDPQTFPIQAYWDSGLSVPASQPITVSAGYAMNSGSRADVFVAETAFSIRIRDKSNVQVDYIASVPNGLLGPDGAASVGFLQPLTGAVLETVETTLARQVWVDQFKLAVDADDTACIERAIATGTAQLLFDGRTYSISDEIVIAGIQRLVGKGRKRTIIKQTDLTKNGFVFQLSSAQGCGLEHMTITANVAETAHGSTGIGLKVMNCNDNGSFVSFDISNFDTGIQTVGCWNTLFSDFRVRYFQTAGLHIAPYDGTAGTAGGGNRYIYGKISNLDFSGSNAASIGIWIQQASGEFFNTIDVTVCNIGIKTQPTATSRVWYLFMYAVLGDTCLTNNWLFDATNGTTVANELSQCWSSNSQGNGVEFTGANLDGLFWTSGWIRDSRNHGCYIANGTNIEITASITRNSAAANNTYHGVVVTGAATGTVRILGARIGNALGTVGTSTQKDNVRVEASFVGVIEVSDCNLNDPGAGGLPINNLSTTATIDFSGNLPRRSVGTNESDRYSVSFGSITTIAAGATKYIGLNGAQAGNSDSTIVLDRDNAVVGFRIGVPTAPGVGQSYTYTVMLNGVATSMTGTITGAGFSLNVPSTIGAFLGTKGDSLTLRCVNSAGGAASLHNCTLIFEP